MMQKLDKVAEALILWETLDKDQIEKVARGEDIGRPIIVVEDVAKVNVVEVKNVDTKDELFPTNPQVAQT